MRNPVEIVVASDSLIRSEINGSGNARWDARTTDHRRTASLWIVLKNPKSDIPNHGSAPYMLFQHMRGFLFVFAIHLSQIEKLEHSQDQIEQPYISNIECSIILAER